ncbi:MAG TPA: dTDP-4-dehydrorhamnose 3,5-epimerase [Thermoleophilaceae bacterium]
MKVIETRLEGPLLIQPTVHGDARGFFLESYRRNAYAQCGIDDEFVQDNHSRSSRGVVRGIHFQLPPGQAKLVRCARGAIFDVVVDLRRGSPSFGEWEGHELSDENNRQLYVPIGFGHGFCVLSDVADVIYKTSGYYDASIEAEIAWNDPDVGIAWPSGIEFAVSDRDANAASLAAVADDLPFTY